MFTVSTLKYNKQLTNKMTKVILQSIWRDQWVNTRMSAISNADVNAECPLGMVQLRLALLLYSLLYGTTVVDVASP
jgi:hypothetical protein